MTARNFSPITTLGRLIIAGDSRISPCGMIYEEVRGVYPIERRRADDAAKMSDRLTLTRAFEGAGLKSGEAERIATEIYDAIHGSAASKADVAAVDANVAATRAVLREEIASARADLGADIASVRTDLSAENATLRADLVRLELRLTLRLGAAGIAVAGILFAALHYWPPHP